MAPNSPSPAPGNSASGPPAPPLCPHSLIALLERDPARGAAVLAAMRPRQRAAQATAHGALLGVGADRVEREWRVLIARVAPRPASTAPGEGVATPCASVYEPEALADLIVEEPALAHTLLRQLSALQRVAQATAYAAWLDGHGMPMSLDDVLASWATMGEARRAAA
ncbi:MAG: hypothetical protein HGA45_09070 [Chloroflexales bacterium]|nr:hypothetical protein [Chloroflexales bacterium]